MIKLLHVQPFNRLCLGAVLCALFALIIALAIPSFVHAYAQGSYYGESTYYGYGQSTYYGYGQSTYYGYGQSTYYGYGQSAYYGYGQSAYYGYGQASYTPPANAMTGYIWSDTIGWISLSGSNYGIVIDASGNLSGYAWSDNIGWISAQSADVAGCPAGTCAPKLTGSSLTGWLKAVGATGNGWDGWISLNCSNTGTCATVNYGITISGGVYSGYAWGSDVVGWIDFTYATSNVLSCSLAPSPDTIILGQSASLAWTTNVAQGGSIMPGFPSAGTASANFSVSPTVTTTYTGTATSTSYSTTTGAGINTTFNSSGSFVVPANIYSIDALVVAGGGGGAGGASGGGGGGGGVVQATSIAVTPGETLTITVGAGGAGGSTGTSGSDSTIKRGASTLVSATGGGGGGNEGENGKAGGSGGGGGGSLPGAGGAGTAGQGNNGGGGSGASRHAGGGGGGSAAGQAGSSAAGASGNGGAGITVSANYGSLVLAGGGGGAVESAWSPLSTGGVGGSGGGGAACGAGNTDSNGVAGTANTGGGGGGGGRCGRGATAGLVGGSGGSGKIIVRYSSVTVTPTLNSASCNATVTVACAPIYSCSGQQIQYTNASCVTTNIDGDPGPGTACVSPNYCTPGQSTCTVPPPSFTTGGGTLTGHLQAKPQVVRTASSTVLYWNVTNVQSCTVSGNGNSWTSNSSAAASCTKNNGGCVSNPITSSAIYTLSCTPLAGATAAGVSETVTVTPSPTYQEI